MSRRILVTNDDGVGAPGITALAAAARAAGWSVVVVAPANDRSGSGAAIGPLGRDAPRRLAAEEVDEAEFHVIDAPPAVAVLAAYGGAFGRVPDGVLSGVNRGLNVGRLLLHSGTVGAALTAANLGIPAVAASLEPSRHNDWQAAAALAVAELDELLAGNRQVACNLNVPAGWDGGAPVVATLADAGQVTAAVADGRFDFELSVMSDAGAREGSDAALLAAGRATRTMLSPLSGVPHTPVATHLEPRERSD